MRLVLMSATAMLVAATATESRITNAELSFSITRPDGFIEDPDGTGHQDILYSWVEESPSSDSGRIVINVQRLNGTIGRERTSEDTLRALGMTSATFRWKSFDIEGARQITENEGLRIHTIFARVPLRREAVMIVVAAPEGQMERAETLMTTTLASLDGESNWLTDEQRAERLGEATGRLIAWPILAVLAILWVRRRRKKNATVSPARA